MSDKGTPWWLGWRMARPSVTESVTFNIETQVLVMLWQALGVGLGATIALVLWVILWCTFPRGWAAGVSWALVGLAMIVVGFWGVRILLLGVGLAKMLFAFMIPAGIGIVNFVMMCQSDQWWADNWPYALGMAVGMGIVAGCLTLIYPFAREAIQRHEPTGFEQMMARQTLATIKAQGQNGGLTLAQIMAQLEELDNDDKQ